VVETVEIAQYLRKPPRALPYEPPIFAFFPVKICQTRKIMISEKFKTAVTGDN
jgi:hypothetical protein